MATILVYTCDRFVPVEADLAEVLNVAERGALELFERVVRPLIEGCVGGVNGVEWTAYTSAPSAASSS